MEVSESERVAVRLKNVYARNQRKKCDLEKRNLPWKYSSRRLPKTPRCYSSIRTCSVPWNTRRIKCKVWKWSCCSSNSSKQLHWCLFWKGYSQRSPKLYIFMNSLLVNHLLMFVSLFLFSRNTIWHLMMKCRQFTTYRSSWEHFCLLSC